MLKFLQSDLNFFHKKQARETNTLCVGVSKKGKDTGQIVTDLIPISIKVYKRNFLKNYCMIKQVTEKIRSQM